MGKKIKDFKYGLKVDYWHEETEFRLTRTEHLYYWCVVISSFLYLTLNCKLVSPIVMYTYTEQPLAYLWTQVCKGYDVASWICYFRSGCGSKSY